MFLVFNQPTPSDENELNSLILTCAVAQACFWHYVRAMCGLCATSIRLFWGVVVMIMVVVVMMTVVVVMMMVVIMMMMLAGAI